MDKNDILEYVMKTPENTNPAVLGDMLDQIEGGNPNYVETIEGTLENPWGNYTLNNIWEMLSSNEATMYIQYIGIFNGYAYGYAIPNGTIGWTDGSVLFSAACGTGFLTYAYSFSYSSNATYLYIKKASSSGWDTVDGTGACTLTIIHHPMPTTP